MIAKAVKGRGFRGALAYDLSKDEGRILDTNMAGEGERELASEFGSIRKLRPNLEKAVLHVSLSAAPGENLSDAQWQAIGRKYLQGMDLGDNQYLITRHTDTEHEHIHILANRITHAGQVVSDSQDYQRQEVLMRAIERDFGLQQLAPSRESQRRAPTRGEIEKQIRTQDVSTRVQLQQLADVAVARSSSYTEYRDHLEAAGVELVPILQMDGAKLSGLMYRLDNVTMKGSDLGKGYSPAGLAKRGVSYEQGRDAAAVGDRQEQEQPGPVGRAGPDDPRRQGAERGGLERNARAAGPGAGSAQQRGDQDPDRDRASDPDGERRLQAPARQRQPEPESGDGRRPPGGGRSEPGSRPAGLEALRPGDDDRARDGGARQRLLALVQAAEVARDHPGSEDGGRLPEAGPDRLSRQAGQREVERLVAERDERVRRVLAKAQRREARREKALSKLVLAQPKAPGLLAGFQRKGHEQAVVVWEHAKALATQLAREARELAQRLLRDIGRPEWVRQWAREITAQTRPQVAGHEQERAATATEPAAPRLRDERVAVQPLEQFSHQHVTLELDWERVSPLLHKQKTAALTSTEKQHLARGWDALAGLIDGGYREAASPGQRRAIDRFRVEAHRQVAADVFLNLPRVEAVAQHPKLASAYGLLEAVDKQAQVQGLTGLQRSQELERAKLRIATAIEQGEALQFKSGELEVVPHRDDPQPEIAPQPEISKDRGRVRKR